MGRGDNKLTRKTRRCRAQKKKKAKLRRLLEKKPVTTKKN